MNTDNILDQLQKFFPSDNYSSKNLIELEEKDEIDTSEKSLANTLKGSLFDETILEVQIGNLENVYYCRVLDNPFDETFAEEDGSNSYKDPDYEAGSYIDQHECVFITPLEPSQGNYLISINEEPHCKIILKIISSGNAIEIGCFFQHRTIIGDMPALKLTFPKVAKKSKIAREFRAKVPKSMAFKVTIERNKKRPLITSPLNISINGMSLLDPMGRKSNLYMKDKVSCNIELPGELPVLVEASVIHVTNMRDSDGIQYCFGIKFHFDNTTAKSAIEKIVGLVQRKHLRELSDLEVQFGVYYDK